MSVISGSAFHATDRCQVGRIGLDQSAVGGSHRGSVTEFLGEFECVDPD